MQSTRTFDEFKEVLREHEIKTFTKFNVYQNHKGFLEESRVISHCTQIRWKDGLPYYHLGSRYYTCHQGKDKNLGKKRKYAEEAELRQTKKYSLNLPTKKLDCPASITVTRVWALPQFKLENPKKSEKTKVSEKIKQMIITNERIEGEEAFWFTLPDADAHKNHIQGVLSKISEPVDVLVRAKIKDLVSEGINNPSVVAEQLEKYVTTELKQNDRQRRRFFPDIPTIKSIMKHGRRDLRLGKVSMLSAESVQFNEPDDSESMDANQGCDDNEDDSTVQKDCENTEVKKSGKKVIGELEEREIKRRKLINECSAYINNLRSILSILPESELTEFKSDLLDLAEKMQTKISPKDSTNSTSEINEGSKMDSDTPKILSPRRKRKTPQKVEKSTATALLENILANSSVQNIMFVIQDE